MKSYILKNNNLEVKFCEYGASIVSIKFLHKEMIVGYTNLERYKTNPTYQGCIVGRSAGRIRNGKFFLNGKEYSIQKNFRGHNLHGNNLHQLKYKVEILGNKIIFKGKDIAYINGYPGNIYIKITYILLDNSLDMKIEVISDEDTLVNFTNHTHFNLGVKNILNLNLKIDGIPWFLDKDLLPIEKKYDEVFNFKNNKKIKTAFVKHSQFDITKFIDHPFQLENKSIYLSSDEIQLKIETNQNVVVVYAGNYLSDAKIKGINDFGGIALETQSLPDGININGSGILKKGETYLNHTTYTFTKINTP